MVRGKPSFWFILIVFMLVGFGLVMVFSASYYKGITDYGNSYFFFRQQLIAAGIGLFLFFTIGNIPYTLYSRFIGWILLGSLALLPLVFLPGIGSTINNATRWIEIGSFSFQPSELAKLGAIFYTAYIMSKKQQQLHDFRKGLLPPLIIIFLFCFLIVIEPDFSTALLLLSSCMIIIFCAGARIKHLLLLSTIGIPIIIKVMIDADYRVDRLSALYDPWVDPTGNGWQTIQSLYAIAPGGLSGSGLGNSIQKMAYLPEAHTDFIFAIVAEELGFLGATFLVLLFIVYTVLGMRIALRTPDTFGSLLGIGIVSLISLQAVLNLGVATAILPVTGVTLPFISYGGTSLITYLTASGVLLNLSRYNQAHSIRSRQSSKSKVSMEGF
ncbi:putative lipid II flippase FtsW [Mechercharimyces sp. CAU 1602]|uniref:putative lipid II flippase FtsW n=1 Tax=Mechercharimyces sp. CAU 1602 TaxID=2973933 RepID=UPI00216394E8|nr:putative lipid II flippase FtsW [Mechercharimyces sp. CAU 1602]MCS1350508.1 putative lipid II flippase FtsW [Mechercharimyces sp. CAU 1602]